MVDPAQAFRNSIIQDGYAPPEIIYPSKFFRYPGLNKGASNRAGWCILHEGCHVGAYGDWSTGFNQVWHFDHARSGRRVAVRPRPPHYSQLEPPVHNAQRLSYQRAARIAREIWNKALIVPPAFPYLRKKHIVPGCARFYKDSLVLPVTAFPATLNSLQFIEADGQKRLLRGGRKKGCFIHVGGDLHSPSLVVICEGWATGCTLWQHHPDALVISAIDAGNLTPVALGALAQWPNAQRIIAGDDDRLVAGNPGKTKAEEAAKASGSLLAMPPWPDDSPLHLSDFNDLATWLEGGAR